MRIKEKDSRDRDCRVISNQRCRRLRLIQIQRCRGDSEWRARGLVRILPKEHCLANRRASYLARPPILSAMSGTLETPMPNEKPRFSTDARTLI